MIARRGCTECGGSGDSLDTFDRPALCGACVRAASDGAIGRWMTVDASRLYAGLAHPAGKGRSRDE